MTLPNNVVDLENTAWSSVFEEVQLNVVPLQYLKSINIEFVNSNSWELKVTSAIRKQGWDYINNLLSDISLHYAGNLQNVEFQLDTLKIKSAVERAKRSFVKKRLY